ncbi:MAG: hypothetical protein ABI318_06565 [Chthoniobacteraceae bacterium]
MHKLSLLITAAIFLTGCEAAKRSRTWETVRSVPHIGPRMDTPDTAYADRLHSALHDARVEHKVVTFKFRYRSRLLLNPEGEETAVIYRDNATPAHPWWLMAERLTTPVWLPSEPVASQAAFYVSRPVTIVKVEDFLVNDAKHARKTKHDGKTLLKPFRQGKRRSARAV